MLKTENCNGLLLRKRKEHTIKKRIRLFIALFVITIIGISLSSIPQKAVSGGSTYTPPYTNAEGERQAKRAVIDRVRGIERDQHRREADDHCRRGLDERDAHILDSAPELTLVESHELHTLRDLNAEVHAGPDGDGADHYRYDR